MSHVKAPEDRLRTIAVSLRPETLAFIEQLAEREESSRSRATRRLVQRGIEALRAESQA